MNTVLFDLDGTLLPMIQEEFVNGYLEKLCAKMAPLGFEPKKLVQAVWAGTSAMYKNDGSVTNCDCFWNCFANVLDPQIRQYEADFEAFYRTEFQEAVCFTRPTSLAHEVIETLKQKGYHLVLATNPLFPQIATYSRIKWAGLSVTDFEWITTYENCSYCKSNLRYFEEILHTLHKTPQECLMVGNDVNEDMVAQKLGIDTYLLTDYIINPEQKDISHYKTGTFEDLLSFVQTLPSIS